MLHSPQWRSLVGLHARQREFERHAELDAQADDVLLVQDGERRRDVETGAPDPATSPRAMRAKELRGRVGKGIAGERTRARGARAEPRAQHRGLGDEHDVAAFEIDVFVRRVVGGRLSDDGPVRGRIDVAHVQRERRQRLRAAGERRRRQADVRSRAPPRPPRPVRSAREWARPTSVSRSSRASSTALSSPPEKSTAEAVMRLGVGYSVSMYLVTKRIDFCYGHRLLDYDGICKHPHGHNAVVEVDVRTAELDKRNMVADFSDIKRIVKGWIDRELDHKMILRHDDPLVEPLESAGRARLQDSTATRPWSTSPSSSSTCRATTAWTSLAVRVWETPTSFAEYSDSESTVDLARARTSAGYSSAARTSSIGIWLLCRTAVIVLP